MKAARCKAAGCRRKAHARGLCQKHYDEQRKSRAANAAAKAGAEVSGVKNSADSGSDDLASKMCVVPGCANAHHAKGYCKMHYGQLRRRGRIEELPEGTASAPSALSREQRLVEIKKRHELLKREIASIHQALESESGDDNDD